MRVDEGCDGAETDVQPSTVRERAAIARDLAEARRWVETIRGYMDDGKRYENHPEDGSAA